VAKWFGWLVRSLVLALGLASRVFSDEVDTFTQALDAKAIRAAFDEATAGLPKRPKLLDLAFVMAEDHDFFEEFPAWSSLTASAVRWYPPHERTRGIAGHMRKAQASLALANTLTHEEILAWYMAKIYLGRGCYGVEAASLAYFGTTPDHLQLEQIALLSAIPKAPSLYDPVGRPEKALERRNLLISELAKAGLVTDASAKIASEKPLIATGSVGRCEG
jgi:membrane peptidoglycan carboxypeptidase